MRGELAAAAEFQFLFGFKAGVDPALGAQAIEGGVIERGARRLALDAIGRNAEPGEIFADRGDIALLRARAVGIVEAEDERPAFAPGKERVQERGARIAHMQEPGRRRGKADDRGRHVRPLADNSRACGSGGDNTPFPLFSAAEAAEPFLRLCVIFAPLRYFKDVCVSKILNGVCRERPWTEPKNLKAGIFCRNGVSRIASRARLFAESRFESGRRPRHPL